MNCLEKEYLDTTHRIFVKSYTILMTVGEVLSLHRVCYMSDQLPFNDIENGNQRLPDGEVVSKAVKYILRGSGNFPSVDYNVREGLSFTGGRTNKHPDTSKLTEMWNLDGNHRIQAYIQAVAIDPMIHNNKISIELFDGASKAFETQLFIERNGHGKKVSKEHSNSLQAKMDSVVQITSKLKKKEQIYHYIKDFMVNDDSTTNPLSLYKNDQFFKTKSIGTKKTITGVLPAYRKPTDEFRNSNLFDFNSYTEVVSSFLKPLEKYFDNNNVGEDDFEKRAEITYNISSNWFRAVAQHLPEDMRNEPYKYLIFRSGGIRALGDVGSIITEIIIEQDLEPTFNEFSRILTEHTEPGEELFKPEDWIDLVDGDVKHRGKFNTVKSSRPLFKQLLLKELNLEAFVSGY